MMNMKHHILRIFVIAALTLTTTTACNDWLDVLPNNDSPNADSGLVNESLNKEIERALSSLTERERV